MLLYEDHRDKVEHKGVVYAIAFSSDGTALFSAGKDGALFLRDAFGQRHAIIEREQDTLSIHSVVYSPDGSLIVGGKFGWQGYRKDSKGSWHVLSLTKTTPTNALAILDEHTLAVGKGERDKPSQGALELWDLSTGRKREPSFLEPNGVWSVATCPTKRMVAWATRHKKVRVWETVLKHKPIDFPQPKPCRAVAINPKGTQFAAAVDYGVKVFNIEKRFERFELK